MRVKDEMLSQPENQENAGNDEPLHDDLEIIDGVTVYKVYKKEGPDLWECLLQAMGKI